jgi:hypothetical protein
MNSVDEPGSEVESHGAREGADLQRGSPARWLMLVKGMLLYLCFVRICLPFLSTSQ